MNKIVLKVKFLIRDIISWYKYFLPDMRVVKRRKQDNIVFLLDVPTYTNLGDQAIGYAERKFFEQNFPERPIIEVRGYMIDIYIKLMKKNLRKNDILVLVGGGNFGDEYIEIEEKRLRILHEFKENKICVFPQTIYYSDSEKGKERLNLMNQALQENRNVLIVAREERSYEFVKKNLEANCIMCPDIVLYLKKNNKQYKRSYAMTCMRDDVEQKRDIKNEVNLLLESKINHIVETDTIAEKWFALEERERVLEDKWSEFLKAKIVITDRLHGMIFCVITGTPCVALPNYNHKIKSFYETWLRDLNYIYFADDIKQIEEYIDSLLNLDTNSIEQKDFEKNFQKLLVYLEKDYGELK